MSCQEGKDLQHMESMGQKTTIFSSMKQEQEVCSILRLMVATTDRAIEYGCNPEVALQTLSRWTIVRDDGKIVPAISFGA
jgi:hypothetical protein